MKRIGTTNEGGALIEFSAVEVVTIQQALELLNEIGGEVPNRIPAPALAETRRRQRKLPTPPAPTASHGTVTPGPDGAHGAKACKVCGQTKPRAEFPKAGGRQCLVCLRAKANAAYAAKHKRKQPKARPPASAAAAKTTRTPPARWRSCGVEIPGAAGRSGARDPGAEGLGEAEVTAPPFPRDWNCL